MKKIAHLLFEAKMLKEIPRSGFHFLGAGKESIAEHSFCTTFIAYVMSQLEPTVDALKLTTMCLVHDLPEARTGDLLLFIAGPEKVVLPSLDLVRREAGRRRGWTDGKPPSFLWVNRFPLFERDDETSGWTAWRRSTAARRRHSSRPSTTSHPSTNAKS